jgi:hypothetical protein
MKQIRRVVITGIGAVTPIGTAKEGLWNGLRAERSAVGPVTRFDATPFRSRNAAEINDFVATDHLDRKRAKRLDRFGQFAVTAAGMAIQDSELELARENRDRVGSMMGTALGGCGYAESQLELYLREGLRAVDAYLALGVFGGAASCNVAIDFGLSGPNSTNAMSCASGTIAVGEGFRQIRDGYAEEYAVPLPCVVFLQLLGLPVEDLPDFLRLKELTLRGGGDSLMSQDDEVRQQRQRGEVPGGADRLDRSEQVVLDLVDAGLDLHVEPVGACEVPRPGLGLNVLQVLEPRLRPE